MIIDHILSFLQYDLSKLFMPGSYCCLCSFSTPSICPPADLCIANVYEPRPEIVGAECWCLDDDDDGDDDCGKEPETEAACAEEKPKDECCAEQAEKKFSCGAEQAKKSSCSAEPSGKKSSCEKVCQKIVVKIAKKCSGASEKELEGIEQRAVTIWNTLNAGARECSSAKYPNWWQLKAWQKLPFYWAALSNEILNEDPLENFKRFLVDSKQRSRRSEKKLNEEALITWHNLNVKQRLPFIMESFIGRVSTGKVNIHDDREIQRVIGELYNK